MSYFPCQRAAGKKRTRAPRRQFCDPADKTAGAE
jgi:hypothetical protein